MTVRARRNVAVTLPRSAFGQVVGTMYVQRAARIGPALPASPYKLVVPRRPRGSRIALLSRPAPRVTLHRGGAASVILTVAKLPSAVSEVEIVLDGHGAGVIRTTQGCPSSYEASVRVQRNDADQANGTSSVSCG
jgi:hypothetical protein